MKRVGELVEAAVGARGARVDIGRDFHLQALVGPLAVVLVDEGIKAGLLLEEFAAAGLVASVSSRRSHTGGRGRREDGRRAKCP